MFKIILITLVGLVLINNVFCEEINPEIPPPNELNKNDYALNNPDLYDVSYFSLFVFDFNLFWGSNN